MRICTSWKSTTLQRGALGTTYCSVTKEMIGDVSQTGGRDTPRTSVYIKRAETGEAGEQIWAESQRTLDVTQLINNKIRHGSNCIYYGNFRRLNIPAKISSARDRDRKHFGSNTTGMDGAWPWTGRARQIKSPETSLEPDYRAASHSGSVAP